MKSALPSARPVLSAARSAANARSSASDPISVVKSSTRSRIGPTLTSPSPTLASCARVLAHRQSSARATRRARTGFIAT
jgi:hypothetical protein